MCTNHKEQHHLCIITDIATNDCDVGIPTVVGLLFVLSLHANQHSKFSEAFSGYYTVYQGVLKQEKIALLH